ncbi:hypothetical protein OXX80_013109 [Metschnikowia pulcherrima]
MFASRLKDATPLPSFDELMHSLVGNQSSGTLNTEEHIQQKKTEFLPSETEEVKCIIVAPPAPQLPQQLNPGPVVVGQHFDSGWLPTDTARLDAELIGPQNTYTSTISFAPQSPSANASSIGGTPSAAVNISRVMDRAYTGTRRAHTCKTCGRAFTTSGHLARHNRIHTGERNHKCPFPGCSARFSRQDNCTQHYRTHMNGKSKRSRGNKLK